MPFLSSLRAEDQVPHVLARFDRGTGRPLLEYHEALLRGESPFTIAEREIMAAYVSRLNSCDYCAGAHTALAKLFGVSEELLDALTDDLDTANIDAKMRPVLRYIRKLTQTPARMTQDDADAVFAAGWDESALYDAVQVCCLYNFMNRFTDGLGLVADPDQFDAEAKRIRASGYAAAIEAFGLK